ncbi:MAG: S1/P1 Nuclease, partial [Pedobacter sp.]|nr:S1/P1 Nuclease [Pedobacter sp.]
YSIAYSRAYQEAMNGMVEKQMRHAILTIGSFWYSAWIDAGQPVLKNLIQMPLDDEEKKATTLMEKKYHQGKIIGREN